MFRSSVCFLLTVAVFVPNSFGQSPDKITLASTFQIQSKILDEERTIVVSLPEGYDEGDAHYPVLYLLDGVQNIWHVVGSTEVLTRTGHMPPVIIVGIKSTNRMRDFTPSAIEQVPYSGGADDFLDFLASELIPYIDSNYRTHPFRILEGHSLGGLFTAYALIKKPALFDAHIIMSPALWWDNEMMAGRSKEFLEQHTSLDKSVYLSIGTEDGSGMRKELARFVETFKENSPTGLRWQHEEMDGEGHMSAPLRINYYGLKFVFADMQLPKQLWETYDDAEFIAHEQTMMKKYGAATKQSGENYIKLGLQLMQEKKFAEAITVFQRNVEAYPIFPPNYAWLADAYEKNNNLAKALDTYQQALEASQKIDYGQEENYTAHIERLKSSQEAIKTPNEGDGSDLQELHRAKSEQNKSSSV